MAPGEGSRCRRIDSCALPPILVGAVPVWVRTPSNNCRRVGVAGGVFVPGNIGPVPTPATNGVQR